MWRTLLFCAGIIGALQGAAFGQAIGVQNLVLYDIDLTTGQASNPRPIRGLGTETQIAGIECGPHGELVALTTLVGPRGNCLYRLLPRVGLAVYVEDSGLSNVYEGGLARDPLSGLVYGVQEVTANGRVVNLVRFELESYTATIVGPITAPPTLPLVGAKFASLAAADYSGLSFDATGALWALDTRNRLLVRLDQHTGTILEARPSPITGTKAGMALNPDDGYIYVLDGDSVGQDMLWRLKPETGEFRLIGPTGLEGGFEGLAIFPAPSPVGRAKAPGNVRNFANFDSRNTGELQNAIGAYSIGPVEGHTGTWFRTHPGSHGVGYCQLLSIAPDGLTGTEPLPDGTFLFRFFYHLAAANGEEPLFQLRSDDGGFGLEARLDGEGVVRFYDLHDSVRGITTPLSPDTEYIVAMRGTPTGGHLAPFSWRIYDAATLEPVDEGSGTGELGETAFTGLRLGKTSNRNDNPVDYFFRGIVIADGPELFYAPVYEFGIKVPVADGTYDAFAGNAPKYQALDELPMVDSDYVLSTLVPGEAMTVRLQSNAEAGINASAIYAVRPIIWARRQGPLDGAIRTRVRSRHVDSDNVMAGRVPIFNEVFSQLVVVDPATLQPWRPEALDYVEIGAVEASDITASRFLAAHLIVMYKPNRK